MHVRDLLQLTEHGDGSRQTEPFDLATSNTEVACVAAVELALASVLLEQTMLLVIDATFAEQRIFKIRHLVTRTLLSGQLTDVGKSWCSRTRVAR